jgi:Spx/MgsR family transcriptional regulator
MKNTATTLYGIRNCDTVKKARQWLDDHGQPCEFHDFKTAGVPPDLLDHWMTQVGWEALLNRKGTTWRRLDEATRNGVQDADGARAVMLANPSVIKRPVVAWGPPTTKEVSVGFKAELWESRLV